MALPWADSWRYQSIYNNLSKVKSTPTEEMKVFVIFIFASKANLIKYLFQVTEEG